MAWSRDMARHVAAGGIAAALGGHVPADADLEARLRRALAAGEITTPAGRDICEMALRVCELELERAWLLGQLDALRVKRDAVGLSFSDLVAAELVSARRQFPPMHTSHEAYAVIQEELDELWDEVKLHQRKRDPAKLLKELVQVAAMCHRAAEDLHLLERASGVAPASVAQANSLCPGGSVAQANSLCSPAEG